MQNQDITYTAFNKVKEISEGFNKGIPGVNLTFTYGLNNQRKKTVANNNGNIAQTKYFFGSYEKTINNLTGEITEYNYLPGGATFKTRATLQRGTVYEEMLFNYTDHLGSITHITDDEGTLLAEQSFDAWGRIRNADDWSYEDAVLSGIINRRGYTGHEMLPQFGIINMNGRLYDPALGRMLSPDNYIQMPDFTQNFNRYSYVLNNPLKYVDPNGEIVILIVGAAVGAFMGYMAGDMAGATGGDLVGYIGVGAVAGAIAGGVGAGVSSVLGGGSFGAGFMGTSAAATATTSFYTGSIIGATSGLTGGFINGTGTSLLQGNSFGESLEDGAIQGLIGAGSGYVLGGIAGGIDARRNNRSFGKGIPQEIYKSPVKNNYGTESGQCQLKTLEGLSKSYGYGDEYNYKKWLELNDGKLGVQTHKIENLVEKSVFKSNKLTGQIQTTNEKLINVSQTLSNDERVMMSLYSCKECRGHSVMVKKLRIRADGTYKIWFRETSPVWIVPRSGTKNLEQFYSFDFWSFY
ncbi:MAG: RHS repeat-associated core domain-containing protein [Bacteroidales bacterium]|nr:RHS repeat-associated core domain-containing protein [Bacteroidales bacterium]